MLLLTLGCLYLFELMFSISLDIYPGVELLHHMVVMFLVFWGTSITVFHSGCTNLHSHNSARGFPFRYILANIWYLWSLWWWPFWQVWGDISLWFWFAFLWWLAISSFFSCAYWPSVCLLWKNVYSGLLPIFLLGCLVFWYWVIWTVCIFGY